MFRACPMRRVTLFCLTSEAQEVALLLARHGCFGPAAETADALPESPAADYREIYLEAATRLEKILDYCGRQAPLPLPTDAVAPNRRELHGINGRLRDIWRACSACHEEELRLRDQRQGLETLAESYRRLRALNVDLSRLLRADGLLDVRLGQVPVGNLRRLAEAVAVAGGLLSVFDRAPDQAFVVVAGRRTVGEEGGALDGLLSQAGWRDLPVPTELQTHPESAGRYLREARQRLEHDAAAQRAVRVGHRERHGEWLRQAEVLLALARPLAESAPAGLCGRGQLSAFTGWVPSRRLAALHVALRDRFGDRCLLRDRAPQASDGAVPSLLVYPPWLRPFAPLVAGYGLPRYGEFDPAPLFAMTFLLLFGAMFGDVGHGAVLFLLAWLLRGRWVWLRGVGLAAGAVSMGFGLLYGSVFGFEDWIEAIWQSPLHDPPRMLLLAVAGGVGFISLTILINVYNRLGAGRIGAALFDGDGLAGLIFFLATALALDRALRAGEAPGMLLPVAALALICVAVWKWRAVRAGVGERAIVSGIETLETVTSLFANTLSFLRVAAFSLNHVALALAVLAIADGLGRFGQGVTLVLGNVLIIGLEGGIVAIQALRLMYYEGFSRFYSGDGSEFRPLRLASAQS